MVQHITLPLGATYPLHNAAANPSVPLLAFKILPERSHSTSGYMGLSIYTAALLMVPLQAQYVLCL